MLLQGGESANFLGFNFRTQARYQLLCSKSGSSVCSEPHRVDCVEDTRENRRLKYDYIGFVLIAAWVHFRTFQSKI